MSELITRLISQLTAIHSLDPSKYVMEVQDPATNSTKQITINEMLLTELTARLAQELKIITNVGLDTTPATLGNLPSLSTMNYIATATDILNACELLDTALKATDDAAIKFVSVLLTNAEIAAITTTPKVLINAPPVGYYIHPISASIKHIFGSVPWTLNTNIFIASLFGGNIFEDVFETLTQSTTSMNNMPPVILNTLNPHSTFVENQPIILRKEEGGNPTGGTGCTARVDIIYKILPW